MARERREVMGSARLGGLRIGRGRPPRLVCVVGRDAVEEARAARRQGADLLELRLDCSRSSTAETDLRLLRRVNESGLPVVVTIRRLREDGWYRDSLEAERRRRLAAIASSGLAAAVDLEADADAATRKTVLEAAARGAARIVASHHDTERVPSDAALRDIVRKASALGDVVKLVVFPRDHEDTVRFLECGRELSRGPVPLVLIAMGEAGRASRIVGHHFGSSLIYTYAGGEPYAAGQYPLAFYRRILPLERGSRPLDPAEVRLLQHALAPA
jgi:3-dehydroquinate dehydratase type I